MVLGLGELLVWGGAGGMGCDRFFWEGEFFEIRGMTRIKLRSRWGDWALKRWQGA